MYFYVWGELLLSELPMELMERLINQVRECWYMGSMLARSVMEKNMMAECTAMGVYCSPCGSHRSSAPSPQPQPARLWFHWLAHRILTPVPSARTSKILSSISFSCLTKMQGQLCTMRKLKLYFNSTWVWRALLYLLFFAPCRMRAGVSSSRLGLSCATTIPSSWSWIPAGVIMTLRRVT